MSATTGTVKINVQAANRQFAFQVFDSAVSMAIARSILEGKTYPRVAFLKDVKRVLDIGANVGAASLFFALQYPDAQVYSVEPCPASYHLLCQNLRDLPQVQSFNVGLFDRDCQQPLYLGKEDAVTNSIGISYLNTANFVAVTLRQARTFCREHQIGAIDILKIDTEGCELPILQSLADLAEKTKVIYLEYHDEADRLAIDELLRPTHILAAAKVLHPHRGELTYVAYDCYPSAAAIDRLRIRRGVDANLPLAVEAPIPADSPLPPTLEPVASETASFGRVLQVLQTVKQDLLLNREFLVSMIRAAGVRDFGPYDPCADTEGVMLQDPHQFADALRQLARYRLSRCVEIGTWSGHTACFLTAFLLRFNPHLHTTCVDPRPRLCETYGLPIDHVTGTSDLVRHQRFDLAFIDGDHSFTWVERDYQNVGVAAPICMFHDIDNADYHIVDPGRFWEHLKEVEAEHQFFEFKYPGKHFMGLGIRVKAGTLPS